ncbi:MAG: ferrochelatase [Candidatus Zixiibacteriota bacterium]|nr:MAG: ferrochelatase [candidate division Zixibacteria bacterium]
MDRAVLLVNMGGPSAAGEVKPYLRAIFRDPAIIGAPTFVRHPLAAWISSRRAPVVAQRYEQIGGASPLPHWTARLAEEVTRALAEAGQEMTAAYAFRYCEPTIEQAMTGLRDAGAKEVHLLPLFPHFTRAMTGSIIQEARRVARKLFLPGNLTRLWWNHPAILELGRQYLVEALEQAGPGTRVLFVAHGIPQRSVKKGEDYPDQVFNHAWNLGESLRRPVTWSLAYQSRLGPVQWIRPYLEEELEYIAGSARSLVLYPLSFVADCLETLYDLDRIASEQARDLGFRTVVRARVFNDDPRFARALVRIVLEHKHAK